jgi:hypothetical protein
MDPSTKPERAGPVRPDYLYLNPFDVDLRKQLIAEAKHLKISAANYIASILAGLGLRGRADTYSQHHRTRALKAANDAIKSAKKMPKKPPFYGD